MIEAEMYGMIPSAKIESCSKRAAGEEVEEAEQVPDWDDVLHRLAVDAGRRDVDAEPVDREHPEGEQEPLAELRDLEDVDGPLAAIGFPFPPLASTAGAAPAPAVDLGATPGPTSPARPRASRPSAFWYIVTGAGDELDLPARLLDRGARAGGDAVNLDGERRLELAAPRTTTPSRLPRTSPALLQRGGIDDAGEPLEVADLDLLELAPEEVLEAELREAPLERHLAALEALEVHVAGAGLLALAAAAGGLAEAGALATTDARACLRFAPLGAFSLDSDMGVSFYHAAPRRSNPAGADLRLAGLPANGRGSVYPLPLDEVGDLVDHPHRLRRVREDFCVDRAS